MDQAAVHAAIPILEGMHVDESEGGGGGLQDGVDAIVAHAVVGIHQAAHEIGQIVGTRADEFRQRLAEAVPLTQENSVGTQARVYETRIFNEDALQTNNLIQGERMLPACRTARPHLRAGCAAGAVPRSRSWRGCRRAA